MYYFCKYELKVIIFPSVPHPRNRNGCFRMSETFSLQTPFSDIPLPLGGCGEKVPMNEKPSRHLRKGTH